MGRRRVDGSSETSQPLRLCPLICNNKGPRFCTSPGTKAAKREAQILLRATHLFPAEKNRKIRTLGGKDIPRRDFSSFLESDQPANRLWLPSATRPNNIHWPPFGVGFFPLYTLPATHCLVRFIPCLPKALGSSLVSFTVNLHLATRDSQALNSRYPANISKSAFRHQLNLFQATTSRPLSLAYPKQTVGTTSSRW